MQRHFCTLGITVAFCLLAGTAIAANENRDPASFRQLALSDCASGGWNDRTVTSLPLDSRVALAMTGPVASPAGDAAAAPPEVFFFTGAPLLAPLCAENIGLSAMTDDDLPISTVATEISMDEMPAFDPGSMVTGGSETAAGSESAVAAKPGIADSPALALLAVAIIGIAALSRRGTISGSITHHN